MQEAKGILAPLADRIQSWIRKGCLVTFLCSEGNMQKMEHLLEGYSLTVHQSSEPLLSDLEEIPQGRLVLREGKITKGFSYPRLKAVIAGEGGDLWKKDTGKAKGSRQGRILSQVIRRAGKGKFCCPCRSWHRYVPGARTVDIWQCGK